MTQQIDGLPVSAWDEDERFMREALAEARRAADEGEVPIGAVVVLDGEVIARAHNRREADADPSAHAEFSALCDAARRLGCWRLTGCTVYVTLEPCLMCAGLMVNARVSRCVFGSPDPKGGATGSLYRVNEDARLNHVFEVTGGVLAGECSELLTSFFLDLRGKTKGARSCGGDAPPSPAEADEGRAGSRHLALAGDCGGGRGQALPALRPAGLGSGQAGRGIAASAPHPRILLAVDSFKGSASSEQVERWLKEGIESDSPQAEVVCLPVADGGEGTLDAIRAARGGEVRSVTVQGPFGRPRQARYLLIGSKPEGYAGGSEPVSTEAGAVSGTSGGISSGGSIAVIEMAEAAGIGLSPCTHGAALAASTYGVGELLLDAVASGARTVYVGLGGSATVDGGSGFLQALGARLRDGVGNEVRPGLRGLRGLRDVSSIELAPAREALAGVELVALSDVRNPLVGPRGAVHVFGPQKGLAAGAEGIDPETSLDACDSWIRAYGIRLSDARDALDGTALQVAAPGARPKSLLGVPGAGAAGGLAAALLALGAKLESGIDTVLDLADFDALARNASLVVTGEGGLDAQSAAGKAPVGIARRAKAVNPRARVIAVCGGRSEDLDAAYEQGIDLVLPVVRKPMALEKALDPEQTRSNLACAGETIARLSDWRPTV